MTAATVVQPAARRALSPAHLVPLALAIVAEAAWVTVVAALVQEFSLHFPTIGIATMAAFVAAGVVAARLFAPRLGDRWPIAALVLSVTGGLIGWLIAPEARAAIADGQPVAALAANPGGWIAAVAVLRGFAHARIPLAEETIAHLFGIGVPGVAVAAIVGGMIAEPWRSQFLDEALIAAVVFSVSAALGLALVRLSEIGVDGGFDWRRNPTWVALLLVLVVATAVVAVPVAVAVAPLIALAIGASIGPILLVGLMVGFDRRTVRILGLFLAIGVIIGVVFALIGGPPGPGEGANGGPTRPPGAEPTVDLISWIAFVVTVAIVLIVVLARRWMRRGDAVVDAVREQRTIDRSEVSAPTRKRTWRWRHAPTNAVTAYRRLLDDLADRPTFRREAAETPSEHARRMRRTRRSSLALDLLAADYELATFAEREISRAEDRRAVGRWRLLRRRLVERPEVLGSEPPST